MSNLKNLFTEMASNVRKQGYSVAFGEHASVLIQNAKNPKKNITLSDGEAEKFRSNVTELVDTFGGTASSDALTVDDAIHAQASALVA